VKGGGLAEVDVQQLGKQAVVKVVCSRRPGHVLRVLNALEECKVEVLQSNVVTVADNSIHFITVQVPLNLALPSPPHRLTPHQNAHHLQNGKIPDEGGALPFVGSPSLTRRSPPSLVHNQAPTPNFDYWTHGGVMWTGRKWL
jgi:hypothetical protein